MAYQNKDILIITSVSDYSRNRQPFYHYYSHYEEEAYGFKHICTT